MPSQDIKDLFLKPLSKITFPRELERKIFLYQQPFHPHPQRYEDTAKPIKKKQKKKKKNKQKSISNPTEISNLPPPAVNIKYDDPTLHIVEIDDPSLALPERKIEKTHKWPAVKLKTPDTPPSQVRLNKAETTEREDPTLMLPVRKIEKSHKWPSAKKDQFKTKNSPTTKSNISNNTTTIDLLGTLLNRSKTIASDPALSQVNQLELQKLPQAKFATTPTVLPDKELPLANTMMINSPNNIQPNAMLPGNYTPFLSKFKTNQKNTTALTDHSKLKQQTNMAINADEENTFKTEQTKQDRIIFKKKTFLHIDENYQQDNPDKHSLEEDNEPLPPGEELTSPSPEPMSFVDDLLPPGIDESNLVTNEPLSQFNSPSPSSPEPLPPGVEPSPPSSKSGSPKSRPSSPFTMSKLANTEIFAVSAHMVPSSSNSLLPPGIKTFSSKPPPVGVETDAFNPSKRLTIPIETDTLNSTEPLPPGLEPDSYKEGFHNHNNQPYPPGMEPTSTEEYISKENLTNKNVDPVRTDNKNPNFKNMPITYNNLSYRNNRNEYSTQNQNNRVNNSKQSSRDYNLIQNHNQKSHSYNQETGEFRDNYNQKARGYNQETGELRDNYNQKARGFNQETGELRDNYGPYNHNNTHRGKQETWSGNQLNLQSPSHSHLSPNEMSKADHAGSNESKRVTRSSVRTNISYNDNQRTLNRAGSSKLVDLIGRNSPMDISVLSSENRKRKVQNPEDIKKKKKKSRKDMEASRVYMQQRRIEMERKMEEKKQEKTTPCAYFQKHGECAFGDDCRFSHDIQLEKKEECCKFYIAGACLKGDKCVFYHSEWPCKFFHLKGYCNSADQCKFSHAAITDKKIKEAFGARNEYERDENIKASQLNDSTSMETSLPVLDFQHGTPSSTLVETDRTETNKEEHTSSKNEELKNNNKEEDQPKEFEFPSLYYELT